MIVKAIRKKDTNLWYNRRGHKYSYNFIYFTDEIPFCLHKDYVFVKDDKLPKDAEVVNLEIKIV